MKKFRIILGILAMGLTTLSCNTDRLPDDVITPVNFWNNEQDVRAALNGVYGYLGSMAGNAWYFDGYADNAFNQYPWESNATNVAAGDINAGSNFGYGYGTIRSANNILANVDRVTMADALKRRYIAETRALRAMNYFQLAYIFGDVPLVTNSTIDADVSPTPEAEVIRFVLSELEAAAADLPVRYGGGVGNETNRITRGAALGFKSRVELYYGQYAEAAADAKRVMDLGTYSLFTTNPTATDYADRWEDRFVTFANDAEKETFYRGVASYQKLFWAANENNNEFMMTNQYVPDLAASYIFVFMMPNEFSGWSSITPTIDLVNAYWKKDGTAHTPITTAQRATYYNNGTITPEFINEFKDRDPRLYASIMFPESPWNNMAANWTFRWPGVGTNNTSRTGFNFKKLVDPTFRTNIYNAGNDYPIMRYAEILLTYAEARNEAAGPDATVYDALDLVRKRAGMPVVARTHSQGSLRELIRNERRIELANEGHRYYDIRRWNIAANVMRDVRDINNNVAQRRTWEPRFMKLPYPQIAIDRNPALRAPQTAKGY